MSSYAGPCHWITGDLVSQPDQPAGYVVWMNDDKEAVGRVVNQERQRGGYEEIVIYELDRCPPDML